MTRADEPAFPMRGHSYKGAHGLEWYENPKPGMSLREHFAGLALQGILAAHPCDTWPRIMSPEPEGTTAEWAARNAVLCADALLAELAKRGEGGENV